MLELHKFSSMSEIENFHFYLMNARKTVCFVFDLFFWLSKRQIVNFQLAIVSSEVDIWKENTLVTHDSALNKQIERIITFFAMEVISDASFRNIFLSFVSIYLYCCDGITLSITILRSKWNKSKYLTANVLIYFGRRKRWRRSEEENKKWVAKQPATKWQRLNSIILAVDRHKCAEIS